MATATGCNGLIRLGQTHDRPNCSRVVWQDPDTAPTSNAKDRVLTRHRHKCAHCGITLGPIMRPEFDHTLPLIDGGQNRESNLQPLCPLPQGQDQGRGIEPGQGKASAQKHLGIAQRKRKIPGRRFDGTPIWGDRP